MTKRTLYALGIFITLLLGTFLFQRLCSECGVMQQRLSTSQKVQPAAVQARLPYVTFYDWNLEYITKDIAVFNAVSASILANSSLKEPIGVTKNKTEEKQSRKKTPSTLNKEP